MNAKGTKTWADYTTQPTSASRSRSCSTASCSRRRSSTSRSSTADTQITGKFTADEAKSLATVLQTGALPVTLKLVRLAGRRPDARPGLAAQRPDRGARRLRARRALHGRLLPRSRRRSPGSSLFVFASLFLGVLAMLSRFGLFALSLPGIAGIVLTIGLAADSLDPDPRAVQGRGADGQDVPLGRARRARVTRSARASTPTSSRSSRRSCCSSSRSARCKGFALTLMIGIVCDLIMMHPVHAPDHHLLAESVIPRRPRFWGVPRRR